MEHPKAIGDRTTLAAMQALQATGYAVSVPFGENVRYDLVIDDGEHPLRVEPSRNGQRRRVRQAAAYEIGRVSVRTTRALRASSDARGSSA